MLIRKYEDNDKNFILDLAPRFSNLNFMEFRSPIDMKKKQEELAVESITKNAFNIYIAEENGVKLGYIELKERIDFFTEKNQLYIAAIAVTEDWEGKGIGKLLLKEAENIAKEYGYSEIVLQVFNANDKAIKLYKKEGYQSDILVMVKEL